jgi:HAD superfamily phosphatase
VANDDIQAYEAIIFDIDGVLVDVRRSYNEAIIKTVQLILKESYDIKIADKFPFENLISKLRNTGGFNNDIDTAYAIILILLYCVLINKMNIDRTLTIFEEIVEKLDDKGKDTVEKELEKMGDIRMIINKLRYPGRVDNDDHADADADADANDNMISRLFNEIFYGPVLFKKQFNKEPRYYFDKPLISNDIVIVREETIRLLSQRFNGNLGLISGRSKVASYFTLSKLMKYFKESACVFLEDEKREFSKPNAFSLHKVFDNLALKSALYVGDSIADLLMVENFKSQTKKGKIFFCGVYGEGDKSSSGYGGSSGGDGGGGSGGDGDSSDPADDNADKVEENNRSKIKERILKSKNADLIIENVNDLPNILNITKN